MKQSVKKRLLLIFCLALFLFSPLIQADFDSPIICTVGDSNDYFKVYPSQLMYTSDTFSHYQLMDGLTVLMIHKQTMQFNRLSNLNLLKNSVIDPNKPPDDYQFFNGSCRFYDMLNHDE